MFIIIWLKNFFSFSNSLDFIVTIADNDNEKITRENAAKILQNVLTLCKSVGNLIPVSISVILILFSSPCVIQKNEKIVEELERTIFGIKYNVILIPKNYQNFQFSKFHLL